MYRFAWQRLPLITSRRNSTVDCKVDIDKCAVQMCRLVENAAKVSTRSKAASYEMRDFPVFFC